MATNYLRVPGSHLDGLASGVVVLDPQARSDGSTDSGFAVRRDPGAVLAEGRAPRGFVLRNVSLDEAHQIALTIRRSAAWRLPIWLWADTAPADPLLDGASVDLDACASQANHQQNVFASLGLDETRLQLDEKILVFLYVRDGALLLPRLDRRHRSMWRFPLVDAWARDEAQADRVIDDLVRRRLLIEHTLQDRVRLCLSCGSAHQHFVDVCPQCHSIDISKAPALHCFACGHVAAQTDFQAPGGLSCPNCHTRLRHIGVDYDRPLTQYVCRACRHVFIEPEILARCLDCGARHEPPELQCRDIYSLALSSQGRTALRSGRLDESFASLEIARFVVPGYFRHMLDWAMAANRRHSDLGFTVVLMAIRNVDAIVRAIGPQRAYALFDELVRRIAEMLRDSDLVTRTHEHRLWFFLPMAQAQSFERRLRKILSDLSSEEIPELIASFASLQTPLPPTVADARGLMQALESSVAEEVG